MKKLLFIVIFSLFSLCYAKPESMLIAEKTKPILSTFSLQNLNYRYSQEDIQEFHQVEISVEQFEFADSIHILLNDYDVVAYRKMIEYRKSNEYDVVFENDTLQVYLSVLNNDVRGVLISPTQTYSVETLSDNDYAIIKTTLSSDDEDDVLEETNENSVEDDIAETEQLTVSSVDYAERSTPVIHILTVFTPASEQLISSARNYVNNELLKANESFKNSGINARVENAAILHTLYVETDFETDLKRLSTKGTDLNVHITSIMEDYGADVCVLVTASEGLCGKAKTIKATEKSAFCLVAPRSSCSNKFSYIHEIGHLIGCRHDRYVDVNLVPYAYCHGLTHIDGVNSWRTMMAYTNKCDKEGCSCPRIPYWSNPDVNYQGNPTGKSSCCNNAKVWNKRVSVVSQFRGEPTGHYAHWGDELISSIGQSNNKQHIIPYSWSIEGLSFDNMKNDNSTEISQYVDIDLFANHYVLCIYNDMGILVKKQQIDNVNLLGDTMWNGLPNGIYFLNVLLEDQLYFQKTIIKQ